MGAIGKEVVAMNVGQEPQLTEACVCCHEDTGIIKNLDINHPKRNGHYVEGGGQLCQSCWKRVYGPAR